MPHEITSDLRVRQAFLRAQVQRDIINAEHAEVAPIIYGTGLIHGNLIRTPPENRPSGPDAAENAPTGPGAPDRPDSPRNGAENGPEGHSGGQSDPVSGADTPPLPPLPDFSKVRGTCHICLGQKGPVTEHPAWGSGRLRCNKKWKCKLCNYGPYGLCDVGRHLKAEHRLKNGYLSELVTWVGHAK